MTSCSRVSQHRSSGRSWSWHGRPTLLSATPSGSVTSIKGRKLMLTGLLQPTHLIMLLAVVLVLFGPKRLPDAGRALGQALREFKASVTQEAQPPLPEAAATVHEETPVQRDRTPPIQ